MSSSSVYIANDFTALSDVPKTASHRPKGKCILSPSTVSLRKRQAHARRCHMMSSSPLYAHFGYAVENTNRLPSRVARAQASSKHGNRLPSRVARAQAFSKHGNRPPSRDARAPSPCLSILPPLSRTSRVRDWGHPSGLVISLFLHCLRLRSAYAPRVPAGPRHPATGGAWSLCAVSCQRSRLQPPACAARWWAKPSPF